VGKQFFSAQADGCLASTAVAALRAGDHVRHRGPRLRAADRARPAPRRQAGLHRRRGGSGSRDPANRDLAFARMRGHGIEIVSREMVAFEWLQRGGTELFREVNRDFIR
jgi:hypothetical protein